MVMVKAGSPELPPGWTKHTHIRSKGGKWSTYTHPGLPMATSLPHLRRIQEEYDAKTKKVHTATKAPAPTASSKASASKTHDTKTKKSATKPSVIIPKPTGISMQTWREATKGLDEDQQLILYDRWLLIIGEHPGSLDYEDARKGKRRAGTTVPTWRDVGAKEKALARFKKFVANMKEHRPRGLVGKGGHRIPFVGKGTHLHAKASETFPGTNLYIGARIEIDGKKGGSRSPKTVTGKPITIPKSARVVDLKKVGNEPNNSYSVTAKLNDGKTVVIRENKVTLEQ